MEELNFNTTWSDFLDFKNVHPSLTLSASNKCSSFKNTTDPCETAQTLCGEQVTSDSGKNFAATSAKKIPSSIVRPCLFNDALTTFLPDAVTCISCN